MPPVFSLLTEGFHDLTILAIVAALFAVFGLVVSWLAHHVWFRFWPVRGEEDHKLADTVQTSLLGFSAFVLALATTAVLANLSRVEEQALQEATNIAGLDRELGALGAPAAAARQALADYVKHVATDEWPRLARPEPGLSPLAGQDLDRLWAGIRGVQRNESLAPPQVRDTLDKYQMAIATSRTQRLAEATKSIPAIFWVIILVFVGAAAFMNGRNRLHRYGLQVMVIHMAAIGLVVALILVVDNPFRGSTSVSPAIIARALDRPQ
ncbi:MAG: DUF4239 domain-containing protein [Proteobacteria bacterium]|nr:DUF4239 domain-containing protein [Pseudomonadota bacterium]